MPVAELVRLCKLRLESVAGEEAMQQAKWLVSAVIGAEPAALGIHSWMQATQDQIAIVGELLERRLSGEPLQYILGEWDFLGLPFYVDARALIPRQDTELLAETAIQRIVERNAQSCLDLCTGTGCVGIAIAKNTTARVTLADISHEALSLAQENAELNEVNVTTLESDLFANVDERFDLIACNPPYLSRADMVNMQKELSFEPELALFGGEDGLDFYRRIANEYQEHLTEHGALLLEIGSTQAEAVSALFGGHPVVLCDLGGNPRVLVVERTR